MLISDMATAREIGQVARSGHPLDAVEIVSPVSSVNFDT